MRALLAIAATLALSPAANGATPAPGALTQLPGKAGCVAHRLRASAHCARGRFGGNQIQSIAVSTDGRNAYVASLGGSLAIFRIARDGSLHQLRGSAGCIIKTRRLGCERLSGTSGGWSLAVSPDGRSVYLGLRRGVLLFARDRRSGALKGLAAYADRGMFDYVRTIAVSPDGRSVYVGSGDLQALHGGVAVFARNRETGKLRQLAGTAGCLDTDATQGCGTARALFGSCCGLAVSPDSKNVYAGSSENLPLGSSSPTSAQIGLAAFTRDTATGVLSQLPGLPGCLSDDGLLGCQRWVGGTPEPEHVATDLVAGPDGRTLYAAHYFTFPEAEPATACIDYFVAVFQRDPTSGGIGPMRQDVPTCGAALSASPDGANLYTVDSWTSAETVLGRAGGSWKKVACLGGFHCPKAPRGVEFPSQLAVAPDGRHAYLAGNSGVAVFSRRR